MDRKVYQVIIALCLTLVFTACVKDKPVTPSSSLPSSPEKVLVVCEGSLGNGNAELSVYDISRDSVYQSVFGAANGQPLGDVFQSVLRVGDTYWLCINNSDKIVLLDTGKWKQQAVITVPKPRYCCRVSDQKVYVGSLFSNRLSVVNITARAVERQLEMPFRNVEGIWAKDNIAYVCCWDTACTKLYLVNTLTDQLFDSIALQGAAPQSIAVDKQQMLWVIAGNAYKNKASSLNVVDPSSRKCVRSYLFDKGVEAIKPVFNPSRDTLYFLEVNYAGGTAHNGVFRMPYQSTVLPVAAWQPCSVNQYFWALGIDPLSGNVYIGDPKGFVQRSSVQVLDPNGRFLHQFTADAGVGAFYFD